MADGAIHGPAGDLAGQGAALACSRAGGRDAGFPPAPGPGECHVWAVGAAGLNPARDYLWSLLDPAERARAAHFHDRAAGRRFVASRACQRLLAARYLGLDPAAVMIDRRCRHCGDPRHGRPRIAGPEAGRAGLEYSVTHTGELLLLAYVSHGLVGIDAERAVRRIGTERLARYALSPDEAALVSASPGHRRQAVFCRLWTRKEAVLKLTGHGLAAPLRSVDVTGDAARAAPAPRPLAWPAGPVSLTDLDLSGASLEAASEYVAAVAATGLAPTVTIRPAAGFLASLLSPPVPLSPPAPR